MSAVEVLAIVQHYDESAVRLRAAADEIVRVLDAARATRWHALFALAFSLGARRGELLALRWPVVDLETWCRPNRSGALSNQERRDREGHQDRPRADRAALSVRARRVASPESIASRGQARCRRSVSGRRVRIRRCARPVYHALRRDVRLRAARAPSGNLVDPTARCAAYRGYHDARRWRRRTLCRRHVGPSLGSSR